MSVFKREDAFELGARLKEAERQERNIRIGAALSVGGPVFWTPGGVAADPRRLREQLAETIYNFRYEEHGWNEPPTAQEVLDALCEEIFGVDYEGVLKAWDEVLG